MNVSVIIPAYNAMGTISAALDSVAGQTRPPDEIIIVDDCSEDDTRDVVEDYIQCSTFNIQLLSTDRNSGPAAARNLGIRNASGEWVAFLDADDQWLPDKLEKQVKFLEENPDVEMVCGGIF